MLLNVLCLLSICVCIKYLYTSSMLEKYVSNKLIALRNNKYEDIDVDEYVEEYAYVSPEAESFEVEQPILIHSANKKMFISDDMVEGIYIKTDDGDDDIMDSGLYSDRDYNEVSK